MVDHDPEHATPKESGPDTRDPQALIAAAEQGAATGDYPSAERLLRQAAALQEASLGPLHPDLANTLNNLGVVCEITDNPVDAEHYFRRACAIASAVLAPDHPFVATSRKNLEDFCTARGKPVNLTGPVSAIAAGRNVPLTGASDRSEEERTPDQARDRAAPAGRRTTTPLIAAGVAAALLLSIAAGAWFGASSRDEASRALAPSPEPTASGTAAVAARNTRDVEEPPKATVTDDARHPLAREPQIASGDTTGPHRGRQTPERTAPPVTRTPAVSPAPASASAPPRSATPVVAAAELCRALPTRGASAWQCVPAEDPVDPGPVFYYTRLKSPADTSVQHRWYRNGRVHQVVALRVRANMFEGFRTYSRQTLDARTAGEWSVELRTTDGTVLHEERFVVR